MVLFIISGSPTYIGVLPSILWFSSLCLCAFLPVLLHHSSVILAYPFFIPLPPSLCDLVGHRPYGLEEDVRQYEQDLAKRLYQARVRASQGTAAAPQPPTSSSTSSSAASQLRSAPRPRPPGPDARHRGVVLGCFDIWGTLLEANSERSKQALAATLTVLPLPFQCRTASARLCCFPSPAPFGSRLSFLFSVLSSTLVLQNSSFSFVPCCSFCTVTNT